MQRTTRRNKQKSKGWRPDIYQVLIVFSLGGLALSLSTLLTRWPYTLAERLNLDSEMGIDNFLKIVQMPMLIFFFFLTLYAIKRSIDKYRRSFDAPLKTGRR